MFAENFLKQNQEILLFVNGFYEKSIIFLCWKESLGRASRKAAHVQKGKKPSEERISNFIARIAAHEETNGLEPIDKASLRVLANYQAVTKVKA
jgi:hypothetical protein